jgi:hypothetical protein
MGKIRNEHRFLVGRDERKEPIGRTRGRSKGNIKVALQ